MSRDGDDDPRAAPDESALREREAELAAIFEGALDAMIIADDDARYVAANPAACELLGTSLAELLGKTPADFSAAPIDMDATWSAFLAAGAMEGEFVVRRPDGSERITEFRAKASIAPGRHLSVLRDVTARRSEEARLEALVRGAPVSIFSVDDQGRVTLAEGRGLVSLGLEPAATVGHSIEDVLPELVVDGTARPIREVLARVMDGTALTGSVVRQDRALDVHLAPKRSPGGTVFGVLAVATDVTRMRRVEQELSRTAGTLQAVIRAATAAIIAIDREGVVQLWNPAAERIFGYPRDAVLGRALPFLEPSTFERVVRRGETVAEVSRRAHRDGRQVDVSLSIAPVRDPDGAVVGAVGVLVDVTDQQRLEAELRHAQKLEGIGRLAAGIAHDFSNILSAVIVIAHGVLEALPAADPLRHDIQEIADVAARGSQLTRQLLAFGRKQRLSPEAVDLNQLVTSTSEMLRRLIPESIELKLELSPEALFVMLDPSQFEQVLLNLVVNARDAMPEGGALVIATEGIEVAPEHGEPRNVAGDRWVRLEVRDTGVGMPAETASRIFEPFFTTKPVGRGTGLGLSTAYGIVRQSGGTIEVDTAPGRGASFVITLPRLSRDQAQPRRPRAPRQHRPMGGETVLVVEDEAPIRGALVRMLNRAGYVVIEAANAGEALLLAEDHDGSIDLLLTDVVMPRVSGPALARRLAPIHPGMKRLFMTGHPRDELELGEAPVLQKPFSPAALLEAVSDALDGD